MDNSQETVLATSTFDSSACHKTALIFYILCLVFCCSSGLSAPDISIGLLIFTPLAILIGGIIHLVLYITAKNNKIVLTNYKITGIYNRHLSLNIPIDSVSSVSKGQQGSLCITCAGNKYNISFVKNRDAFCSKLNELLNERARHTVKNPPITSNQQLNCDEIVKLKQLLDSGVITQEEFEAKKKQLLGL